MQRGIEFKPVSEFKAEVFWNGSLFGHIVWGTQGKGFVPLNGPGFTVDTAFIEGVLKELASKP